MGTEPIIVAFYKGDYKGNNTPDTGDAFKDAIKNADRIGISTEGKLYYPTDDGFKEIPEARGKDGYVDEITRTYKNIDFDGGAADRVIIHIPKHGKKLMEGENSQPAFGAGDKMDMVPTYELHVSSSDRENYRPAEWPANKADPNSNYRSVEFEKDLNDDGIMDTGVVSSENAGKDIFEVILSIWPLRKDQ